MCGCTSPRHWQKHEDDEEEEKEEVVVVDEEFTLMSFCSVGERPSKTTVCLAVSAVETAKRSMAICTCFADATGLSSIFAKLNRTRERTN